MLRVKTDVSLGRPRSFFVRLIIRHNVDRSAKAIAVTNEAAM
jgi:hypothetical protein